MTRQAARRSPSAFPGLTSWLASGSFDTVYPGLNDFGPDYYTGNVNAIYQSYHIMLYMYGIVIIVLILSALVLAGKVKGKWALRIMLFGWLASLLAIEFGWLVAELGRQPWIVYGELLTADATSEAVPAGHVIATLIGFFVSLRPDLHRLDPFGDLDRDERSRLLSGCAPASASSRTLRSLMAVMLPKALPTP